jgi:glycosyltransferase involved in cell wall biosynthesis
MFIGRRWVAFESYPPTLSARFSVVLPVHNGGDYLRQAVQSVLEQTHADWHLAILENGSDDGTAQWLETLKDPRIAIHAAPQLLSIEENWARISEVPCGEFLTLLGHDDLLDPDYLEEMTRLIAEFPEASLYQTQFRLIDAAGNALRSASPQPEIESAADFLGARLRRERESFGTGYLMRTRDYRRVGGIPKFRGLLFSDDALWLQLMRSGVKATSPRECFAYRTHEGSSSVRASWENHLDAMEEYLVFLRAICREDAAIEAQFQRHRDYFLWHAHQAYAIALTGATQSYRRLDEAAIRRFNAFLSSVDANWNLKTQQTRGLKLRELINRFAAARVLYNRVQKSRYNL